MFFRCLGLMIITIASRSFQSCFIVQFWYGANTDHGVFDILFCSSLHLFCTIVWFFITGGLQRWLKSLKHFKKEFYRTFFYTIAQKQNISHCIFLNPKITHFLEKKKKDIAYLVRISEGLFFKRFILNTCIKIYLK